MTFFQRKTRGAKLEGFKNTRDMKIKQMPVPDRVWIAMNQHTGLSCQVLVKKGDSVAVGQKIGDCDDPFGVPVYSSVSGTIASFEEIALPTGDRATAIAIDTDKKQTLHPAVVPPTVTDNVSLIEAVRNSGMVGLGGAGFPTYIKMASPKAAEIDTLLINAAECEPFLTSDFRVMMERTDDILRTIELVLQHTEIERCVIATEDNKPEAVELLLHKIKGNNQISITVLPTIYPQGSEIMLLDQALGRIVPEGGLPADVGAVVINVTTAAELGLYFKTGLPLIEKNITVDGDAIAKPQNVRVAIGASVHDVAEFCGGYVRQPHKILMGGPMMGLTIYDESYPVLRNNNGLLFFDEKQTFRYEEIACIACGRCTRACPMHLMPFQLKRANERKDVPGLLEYKINLCIECGSCSYVCPSRQDLVQSHRMSKAMVNREEKKQ